jgi:hypothetical protein
MVMSDNARIAAEWSNWCEKVERAGLKCRPCAARCCHLKGREQRRYKGYDVHDTILVCGDKNGGVAVETDIEIPFQVPKKNQGGMGIMGLMQDKQTIVTMALRRGLDEMRKSGVQVSAPFYHKHYNPNRLPEIGAIHVHVRAPAKTATEGKQIAEQLWNVIDTERLEKLIE